MENKTAFSLVELSIVLLIIGIVIGGITQSGRLYSVYRLGTARTLTQSSDVTSISNLAMWYDATHENSFTEEEVENEGYLTSWRDVNPQSNSKHDGTTTSDSNRPLYISDCIKDLPCVRFDDGEFFLVDASFLVNKHYSVFVVEQRHTAGRNWFIGGLNPGIVDRKMTLGYSSNTAIDFGHAQNFSRATVPGFSTVQPAIHSFLYNSQTGRDYYYNGDFKTLSDVGSADETAFLKYYAKCYIGKSGTTNYNYDGDIGEIIIFTKTLTSEERIAVQNYLAKKWGVTLS